MALASGTLSLLKEAIGSTHQLVVDVEVTVGAAYLALWLTLTASYGKDHLRAEF